MPEMYVKIRDKLIADGMSAKKAKTFASKIYNKRRQTNKKLPKLSNKGD